MTKIGSEAASKLISLIENPKSTITEQIIIPGELFPGGTVKKMRSKITEDANA